MVYSSLKKLLDAFPYFLNKSSGSNFYKSESVFNELFKGLYNDLFEVYQSFHLGKRLIVWREQYEAYNYSINFIANFPYLKTVTCYKNDEVIYSESYNYDDEIDTFIYSYDSSSETIIPTDKYSITVETWEEYTLTKGYPENDTALGNIYDHDESLDHIGELHNIPRKKYKEILKFNDEVSYIYTGNESIPEDITVTDMMNNPDFQLFLTENDYIEYYQKTDYPFNDKLTEDDYHYMNRIIQYMYHSHDTPLPVLEIWKLYGLPLDEISLINRERYLCKMFEENRHLNSDGEYDYNWTPKPWEHKDLQCVKEDEDIFFFANVNNSSPIEGQTITFNFNFFNEFARKVVNKFYIVPYINGELYDDDVDNFPITSDSWNISTVNFPDIESVYQFDFTFRAYTTPDFNDDTSNYLESDTLRVIIKGCDNADLYVDCIMGSDNNDGKTRETAFRTLPKAISQIQGLNNVIVLVNKNERFYIDDIIKIDDSCSIISCPAGAIVYQNNGWDIFKVMQDKQLYLQNITLKHKCCELLADSTTFTNENRLNYPITVTIPDWVCKINTVMRMNESDYTFYAHHNYNVTGMLLSEDGNVVADEEITLYDSSDNLIDTTSTNTDGRYTFTHNFTNIGSFKFEAKHLESKKYCNSETNYNVNVQAMPTVLTASTVNKLLIGDTFTVDYSVIDYYEDTVSTGTLKLYQDNVLVKTITNGAALSYKPTTDGTHNYRLVYSNGNSYVESTVEFSVSVVKLATSIILLGEGKSTYLTSENINLTGTITDETSKALSNASLKLYDGTTLKATLTSNNKGEVSWSGKLSKGTHNLRLEYAETTKYYPSTSNVYRVRVRESELSDINLTLYPEHKVLLTKTGSIPLKVFASDSNGNPIKTSFKIWDTYNNSCELNNTTTYTTGNDGWCSINFASQAIVNCEGTYLQAISTVDEDVYSNLAHVIYTATPEIDITGGIFTEESIYSYSDDVIHVNGYLVDSDDDPVPNENVIVEMIVDNATIESKTLTTNILGEYNTTFTTNSTIRGKDITFKLKYNKTTKKYVAFTDTTLVEFKQLNTNIITSNMNQPTAEAININGEILDENNRPVDTGTLNIIFNNTTYTKTITDGTFNLGLNDVLKAATYPIQFKFVENTYYKASNTSKNLVITKVTPVLNVESAHSIPVLESTLIPFSVSRNTRIPLTGNVILKDTTTNTEITSADVNANELTLLFDETKEIPCKLTYAGNDYLNSVSKNITLTIYGPYYIITCNKDEPWEIRLVDNEFPSTSDEEYLVLTELTDGYPKLIITSDIDYDTSDLTEDDVVVVDSDETEPDILLIDEGEGE